MTTHREDGANLSSSRTIAINGVIAATQVALTSVGYLLAYRIISGTVGIEVIGAWTLCLALGSISTIADFGTSDGMIRTIALRADNASGPSVRQAFVTGIVFCTLGCAMGATVCLMLLDILLPLLASEATTRETMQVFLLPAIIVAVINVLSLSCMGVLEGLERYGLRLLAGSSAIVVFIVAVFALVPRFGVDGIVWAYLAQASTSLIISMALCLRLIPRQGNDSNRPSWRIARELVSAGLPVRMTGLVTLALDPLTRVAATFYGGALAAGHYEIASRFVMQLRALIVAGFQAGLPRLVKLRSIEQSAASAVEAQLFRAGTIISVGAFTMAALCSPAIYDFIFGHVPRMAMIFFMLLCAGWCVNAISAPFFLSLVANRRSATILMSSGLMALINVPLSWVLGSQFGAAGVVAALAIAVATGSSLTIVARLRADGHATRILRAPEIALGAASILALAICFKPTLTNAKQFATYSTFIPVTALYAVVFALVFYQSRILRR